MSPFTAVSINFKKLKTKFSKAAFLIIPVALLVALGMIVASQTANFRQAASDGIFAEVGKQGTIIQITKTNNSAGQGRFQGQGNFFDQNSNFTDSDISTIKQIPNVTEAIINYTLPINQISTQDLVSGSQINLNNLTVLNSESASLFSKENFDYQEGQTTEIPIILNTKALQETYQDWGGKDSIEVTFQRPARGQTQPNNSAANEISSQVPIKTRTLDYNKDDLLNKTFSIQFVGLDAIPDYTNQFSNGSIVFSKVGADEISAKETAQKTEISKYWDYDALSKPLSYTFKIVGLVQSDSNTATYIPENFGDTLVKDYIQNQLTARNSTEIDATTLSSNFKGLTYNGLNLQNNATTRGPGGMNIGGLAPRGNPQDQTNSTQETTTTTSYTIPGLVTEVDGNNSNQVVGEYKDAEVFSNSVKTGNTITIKIDSIFNRQQVVSNLNQKNYAYNDVNNYSVFENIQNNLNNISTGLVIAFVILSGIIVLFNMSKSVSESTKEIGIFRAVGFTKLNILTIFTLQGLIYTGIGYAVGLLLGVVGNFLVSAVTKSWFENLLKQTVVETFGLTPDIDYSIFTKLDWSYISLLSGILLIITISVTILLSLKAANVSPVEAIKTE
jgi:ABC-type antimicrobial peptide transport system permease subunit